MAAKGRVWHGFWVLGVQKVGFHLTWGCVMHASASHTTHHVGYPACHLCIFQWATGLPSILPKHATQPHNTHTPVSHLAQRYLCGTLRSNKSQLALRIVELLSARRSPVARTKDLLTQSYSNSKFGITS